MKKHILIVFILIFILSSCDNADKPSESTQSSTSTEPESTTLSTIATTSKVVADELDISDDVIDIGENAGELVRIDDFVFIDDDRTLIRGIDLDLSSYPKADIAASLRLDIKNKTDKDIHIGVDSIEINGMEMPTVYDEILVSAKAGDKDIITLLEKHFLSEVAKIDKIEEIKFTLYVGEKDRNIRLSKQYSYANTEKLSPNKLRLDGYKSASYGDMKVYMLSDRLYDNGREIVVPLCYTGNKDLLHIVAREASINEDIKFKASGYQKCKSEIGYAEAFIDKAKLEDIDLDSLELELEIFNDARKSMTTFKLADRVSFIK